MNRRSLEKQNLHSSKGRQFYKSSPIFEPDQTQIIDLNYFQSLTGGVKHELDAVLTELDAQVKGEGVLVTVGYLHSLDVTNMALD